MKIEEQLVNLELSKQLKKLNVKQNSLWYWCKIQDEEIECIEPLTHQGIASKENYYSIENLASSFSVAELGEMLPATLECYDNPYIPCEGIHIETGKERDGNWVCNDGNYYAKDKSEANARAKMMIYVLSDDCYCDDSQFLKWRNSITNKRKMVTVK